jgi:hypothetical protein
LIDRYGAIGDVLGGAVVFEPNVRISDTNFPPEFGRDPVVNGVYMGDYDQAAATTNSFVLTWGDNRLPSHGHTGNNADVRFADVPFSVAGPSVITMSPRGNILAPVSSVRVRFDEEIDPNSFGLDQVASFTDPLGNAIDVTDITPVAGSNNRQFDLAFATQFVAGTYTLDLGPNIMDVNGNPMDQNHNGIPGEPGIAPAGDEYEGQFTILGPAVVSTTLTGTFNNQVIDHGRLVFNEPIDPSSFTLDQFALVDPSGNAVNITGITPSDGTNTRFDVTFDPQAGLGMYSVTVGPSIVDIFGNAMTAPFTGQFTIIHELIVNGGFETGNFNGWTLWGDSGTTGVSNTVPVHSGTYAAYFRHSGSVGGIMQNLSTTVGQSYTLSLWLDHPFTGDTGTEYQVSIGGTIVDDQFNMPSIPYTPFTYTYTATTTTTTIRLGFLEPAGFFYVDDVSFTPNGPAPAPHGGSGGQGAFGGAVVVPGQAPTGGTGVCLPGVAAVSSTGGAEVQSSWEAQRVGLVDQLFASLRSKDAEVSFPVGIIGTGVNVDPLAWDRLGTTVWSL